MKLNFDIEGSGLKGSMIFISGHSYSITNTNEFLRANGKSNYFCSPNVQISSKELVEILNEKLQGEVTADQVSFHIAIGLLEKYPCSKAN